ncbi:MAG TPA: RidA family protein [Gammaproteobacteria bacterium]|nr:RidA family protein [Gammaproteobacteria bacterium]
MRKIIHTEKSPAAIGSYSQAVESENTLYLSGQIPLDPQTMVLIEGDIHRHVSQVFENMKWVLEAGKSSLDEVVKLTVYLTDLADVGAVNEGIARYFQQPFPARTTIQVAALPKGATVEIEAIAVRK